MSMIDRTFSPKTKPLFWALCVHRFPAQLWKVDFIMFHHLNSIQPVRHLVTAWDGCFRPRKASGVNFFQHLYLPNKIRVARVAYRNRTPQGVFQAVVIFNVHSINQLFIRISSIKRVLLRHPCGGRVGTTPKVLGSFGTGTGGTASAFFSTRRRDPWWVEGDTWSWHVMACRNQIQIRSRNSRWGRLTVYKRKASKSDMLLLSHGYSIMHHTEFTTIQSNCLIVRLPSTASKYSIVHATSASFYRIDFFGQTSWVHSGNLTRLAEKNAL